MPSSRDRTSNSRRRRREELLYDKEKLLANGDRWERILAKNIELTLPIVKRPILALGKPIDVGWNGLP